MNKYTFVTSCEFAHELVVTGDVRKHKLTKVTFPGSSKNILGFLSSKAHSDILALFFDEISYAAEDSEHANV